MGESIHSPLGIGGKILVTGSNGQFNAGCAIAWRALPLIWVQSELAFWPPNDIWVTSPTNCGLSAGKTANRAPGRISSCEQATRIAAKLSSIVRFRIVGKSIAAAFFSASGQRRCCQHDQAEDQLRPDHDHLHYGVV